jgi:hypothetical protein
MDIFISLAIYLQLEFEYGIIFANNYNETLTLRG